MEKISLLTLPLGVDSLSMSFSFPSASEGLSGAAGNEDMDTETIMGTQKNISEYEEDYLDTTLEDKIIIILC